jgi:hypothetical protein
VWLKLENFITAKAGIHDWMPTVLYLTMKAFFDHNKPHLQIKPIAGSQKLSAKSLN